MEYIDELSKIYKDYLKIDNVIDERLNFLADIKTLIERLIEKEKEVLENDKK